MIAAILSVNQAAEGTIRLRGRQVRTGIHKKPTSGPVWLGPQGLADDVQVDRRYHGGPQRALCVYGAQHWPTLAQFLGERHPQFLPGDLGENLTLEVFDETQVRVGDVWACGEARLVLMAPRRPCVKLGAKLGHAGLPKKMLAWGCLGAYFSVAEPGWISNQDVLVRLSSDPQQPILSEVIAGWAKS